MLASWVHFWPLFLTEEFTLKAAKKRGVYMYYSKQPDCLSENILSHITVQYVCLPANCLHVCLIS